MRTIHEEDGLTVIEVVIIIVVLTTAAFLVFRFVASNPAKIATQQTVNSEKKGVPTEQKKVADQPPADHDKEKTLTMYELHGSLITFRGQYGEYPEATPAGWAKMGTLSGEPVRDPYTNTVYAFTEKDPEYGEIQYKYPASCDKERKEFVAPTMKESFAFRLKFSDGIRCTHNL